VRDVGKNWCRVQPD